MDAQRFLAEFGHIANAPGGMDCLRDLILDLAIQGRLILSNEKKESTLDLLAEISQWRATQIKSKKGRRTVDYAPVTDREKIYAIPEHWVWVRNSEIFGLTKGKIPKDLGERGKYPYLDIEALDRGNVQRYTNDDQAPRTTKANILVVCDGSRSGLVLNGNDGVIGSTLAKIDTSPAIQPFVKLLFLHSYRRLNAGKKGAAIPHLDTARLLASPCGLPPINDQKNIVAKVDELMALCDKLEAQQQERRKLQNNLRQSILQAVANANNPNDLQSAWTRLVENFGNLFDAPADVRELRDLVFDLALRGAFLPGTAEKVIRENLNEDEPPLPYGWEWKTLAELSEYITSGSRGWKAYLASSGDAFIRSQDIKHDELIFENPAFVALPDKAEGKRTLVQQGDLLLTITGGNVGKCATVPVLPYKAYVSQHVALIRLHDPSLSHIIHFWMINAYGGRRFLSRYIYGDKPGLNLTQVGSVLIPVPPEAVRTQILDNLHSYKIMCDRLADQIRAKKSIATALASQAKRVNRESNSIPNCRRGK
jgi:type I restriction enzyme S subunit